MYTNGRTYTDEEEWTMSLASKAKTRKKTGRIRRTQEEIGELDLQLHQIVEEQRPMTVRGAFYQAEVAGLVPKDEKGYAVVQRRLLSLRRRQLMPYGWITDGTRTIYSHSR